MGVGTGGTQRDHGTTQSKEACEAHVLANDATANGVTWDIAGKSCYAEYGMTGACLNQCTLAQQTPIVVPNDGNSRWVVRGARQSALRSPAHGAQAIHCLVNCPP